jgi:CrcB protein
MLTLNNFLAVAIGGLIGSLLRWLVSVWLNPLWPPVPLGTMAVNVAGSFIIGMALAWFIHEPQTSVSMRLLITSGFCGGFTTLSAFSAEVVGLLLEGRVVWAFTTMCVNVIGAFAATYLGMKTVQSVVN